MPAVVTHHLLRAARLLLAKLLNLYKERERRKGRPFSFRLMHFYFLRSCTVDGLPLNEFRVLAEKSTSSPEYRDEKNRRVEFATPTFNVLNALEQMGYKVSVLFIMVTISDNVFRVPGGDLGRLRDRPEQVLAEGVRVDAAQVHHGDGVPVELEQEEDTLPDYLVKRKDEPPPLPPPKGY